MIVVARPITSGPRTRRRIGITQVQAQARVEARARAQARRAQAPAAPKNVIGSQSQAQIREAIKAAGKSERSVRGLRSPGVAASAGAGLAGSLGFFVIDSFAPYYRAELAQRRLAASRSTGPTTRRRAGQQQRNPLLAGRPDPGVTVRAVAAPAARAVTAAPQPVAKSPSVVNLKVKAKGKAQAKIPKAAPSAAPRPVPAAAPVSVGAQALLRAFLPSLTPQLEQALGLSPTRGTIQLPSAAPQPRTQQQAARRDCPAPEKKPRRTCERRGPPKRITVRPCLQFKSK